MLPKQTKTHLLIYITTNICIFIVFMFMFLFSSGGSGQSSAKSSDKAFEDWLSDDVNSYQR